VKQYRLVTAEKELLEQTLNGSIKVLTQILSLLNPEAFGRASRISRYAREVALTLKMPQIWQVETAAMLSQIGCIMLRPETLAKLHQGQALNPEEMKLLEIHPHIAADLLKHIPRLEEVCEIIAYQDKRFDGGGTPRDNRQGADIPAGARILKLALDFDTLSASGMSNSTAVAQLKQRSGWYDPDILSVLEAVLWIEDRYEVREVPSKNLMDGMILDADVCTRQGILLVSKGQEVNFILRKRLHAFAETTGLNEPFRVLVPLPEKPLGKGNKPLP
jgi:response regulator RpfG family c-di-GMP phosphodiesterase